MGADLKIVARFPEGDVLINQFNDITSANTPEDIAPVS